MEQKRLYAHQLVAEALTLMRREGVNSFPVYDNEVIVGKVSYNELTAFIGYKEKLGSTQAHKEHFDISSALAAIREMRVTEYRIARKQDLSHKLIAGLSSVAVVAVALLGLSWLFIKQTAPIATGENEQLSDQITLTLANGEQILLNNNKAGVAFTNNELNYTDGSKVLASYNNQGQQVMLNIPRGGLYQVILPDGSKAWLNAASQLKFPATFAGAKQRRVELTGEAYFEIAKDKNHPFIVKTGKQEVEVLGTHFNVSAYGNDNSVKTTLIEGSVRITPFIVSGKGLEGPDPSTIDPLRSVETRPYAPVLKAGPAVVLRPNQQAVFTGKDIAVTAVDALEATAWIDGQLIFRNMPLKDVMQVVTRWYNVEVIYQDKAAGSALLGGSVSKFEEVEDVLNTLGLLANVHFKLEGRRITVTK